MSDKGRKPGRPAQPITRDELLAIARRAFAQRGYAGASLNSIADAAGLRKASLYHHFPEKRALYGAVLEQVVGDLSALLSEARLDEGDFAERLDRLGALIVDYFGEQPDAARLLTREVVGDGVFATGEGSTGMQIALATSAAFLQAGMDAGAFRRQDPRQLTVSIAGVHLLYFGAADVVSPFIGGDVREPSRVVDRREAVLDQVRRLVLA